MKKPDFKRKQHGFTLIEIMIAITIGLVMLAGILQISQANKASSRLQRNMGFVQENMRIAMELLTRDIHMAGFNGIAVDPTATPQPAFLNVVAPTTDIPAVNDVPRSRTADGGADNNDQITLTYQFNTDCLGQAVPVPAAGNPFATNHYFIRNNRLMCRGNIGAEQPLVEGVESLQILYGENTDGDPRSTNRYVRADQVADMANVVSVRIGMRFISREAVRSAIDTNSYALLDATPFEPNDRLLRREITTTISLRN
ncbi:MAG: PilW family protein [Gammaproteobacteria bacterium]|nr:PilW family protein [Gammaproteobacteria bacterium]